MTKMPPIVAVEVINLVGVGTTQFFAHAQKLNGVQNEANAPRRLPGSCLERSIQGTNSLNV